MIDEFGADVSGRAGAVLDHHRLAPFARQPVADKSGNGVGGAAGSEGDDDFDGAIRIVLRESPNRTVPTRQRSASSGHGSAGQGRRLVAVCASMPPPAFPAALAALGGKMPRHCVRIQRCRDNLFADAATRSDDGAVPSPCRDRRRRDRRPVRGQCADRAGDPDVSVYEQAPAIGEVGAGVFLTPNSVRHLQRIGLEPAVEKWGARVGRESRYFRHDGAPIAPVQVTDSSGWNATFGMHRADLVDMLAAALPHGTVHAGHRCSGFEQDGDAARVSFANGAVCRSRHRHRRRWHPFRASALCVSAVAAGLPRLGRLSRAGAA